MNKAPWPIKGKLEFIHEVSWIKMKLTIELNPNSSTIIRIASLPINKDKVGEINEEFFSLNDNEVAELIQFLQKR